VATRSSRWVTVISLEAAFVELEAAVLERLAGDLALDDPRHALDLGLSSREVGR
jgi:hypothetical protein